MLQRHRRKAAATGAGPGAGSAGNAAIEFALTAPALFMFLFGIIAFGRALWLQNALDYAVAAAARCASVNPTTCGTADQIRAYAAAQGGAGFSGSLFSVSSPGCGTAVSASYPLSLSIPFVPAVSLTLTAQACDPS